MESGKDAVSTYITESLRLLRTDRERLEELSREIGSLTQNNEHLCKDRDNLRRKITESTDNIRNLEKELEDFNRLEKDNSALQTQLDTSNNNYEAARKAVKDSFTINKFYADQDSSNRNKIKELMNKLEELEKQREGYHALEERVGELQKQVDENPSDSLKDTVEVAYEIIGNKNKELDQLKTKTKKLIIALIFATGISLVAGYFLGSGCSKANKEYAAELTK
ncbi:hypothetical protein HZA97_01210 [Candidatus Woesearchaeota archaeon]|nr:hypothetical protein [Candidatus Woesearchaeota archaeon]